MKFNNVIIEAFLLFFTIIGLFSCSDEAEDVGWTWGNHPLLEPKQAVVIDYVGCSILEWIESTSNKVTFSCGYQITSLLPDRIKHLEVHEVVDDGSLNSFSFIGVVLVSHATQTQLERERHDRRVIPISDVLRVAKIAGEIEKPEKVLFESISLNICKAKYLKKTEVEINIEKYWEEVNNDFILCWDSANNKQRAYQLISPDILSLHSDSFDKVYNCDVFYHPGEKHRYYKALYACYPILDQYVKDQYVYYSDVIPVENKIRFVDFIDEVLPRSF